MKDIKDKQHISKVTFTHQVVTTQLIDPLIDHEWSQSPIYRVANRCLFLSVAPRDDPPQYSWYASQLLVVPSAAS